MIIINWYRIYLAIYSIYIKFFKFVYLICLFFTFSISIDGFIKYIIEFFVSWNGISFKFFINIDSFINYSISSLLNYIILFFGYIININSFIHYNIWYHFFWFEFNYLTKIIINSKDLLDHLVNLKLFKSFYLYKGNKIIYKIIEVCF